jgi:diadenosine tetraphosphate (Ap4A) HIT family hydrolase
MIAPLHRQRAGKVARPAGATRVFTAYPNRAVLIDGCLSCDLLAGKKTVPGGVIHDGDHWLVLHQASPIRYPGYLFVVLKRHCEHIADLAAGEAASLGPTTRLTCQALRAALSPATEKVYVCSFGEGVKHVHFHVIPRLPGVPGGVMPFFTHLELRRLLDEAGLTTWAGGTRRRPSSPRRSSRRRRGCSTTSSARPCRASLGRRATTRRRRSRPGFASSTSNSGRDTQTASRADKRGSLQPSRPRKKGSLRADER